MPKIELNATVTAPPERLFDLSRSVDVHVVSTSKTNERAIGGVTSGLMELHDEVTWSARHLGWRWRLTSRITAFDRPHHFRDSMVRGVFRGFDHDHWFETNGQFTRVREVFDFASPLGPLGHMANWLLVTRHMRRFLAARLRVVCELAESDDWRRFLTDPSRTDHPY